MFLLRIILFLLRIISLPFLVVLLFIRFLVEYVVYNFSRIIESFSVDFYSGIGSLIFVVFIGYLLTGIFYIFQFIARTLYLVFSYPFTGYDTLQEIFNDGIIDEEYYCEIFKDIKKKTKNQNIEIVEKTNENIFDNNDNNAL